jgi:hypothetical protein
MNYQLLLNCNKVHRAQVPAKSADQAFSLLNLGLKSLIGPFLPPIYFFFYTDFGPPWVDTCGG